MYMAGGETNLICLSISQQITQRLSSAEKMLAVTRRLKRVFIGTELNIIFSPKVECLSLLHAQQIYCT